jgi:hypothetical protein
VVTNVYYEYPHAGWWLVKERIAKGMSLEALRWSRKDCSESIVACPQEAGKYTDELSIYHRELTRRELRK